MTDHIICIGDIHGHYHKLLQLWGHLKSHLTDFDSYAVVFLGDYTDRGPQSREVIEFLCELKRTRPNTYFICGNHDLAFMAYIGILPDKRASYRDTWDRADIYVTPGERGIWYRGPGYEDMHLQGRRWEAVYNAADTFKSYGCTPGNRAELIKKVPEHHKAFLTDLPWIVELPGFMFVHAGFEEEGEGYCKMTLSQQLEVLRQRSAISRPEMMCGRDYVMSTPKYFQQKKICVVSGHHHAKDFDKYRVIIDTSGGNRHGDLECVIFPQLTVISHEGAIEYHARSEVFQDE